ncbi:hypothetical protein MASR2M8_16160 [Opitutaceae bacterium]
MEQLQQFLSGSREFDAISTEDFILPVDVWPDGSVAIKDSRTFEKHG